MLSYNDNAKWYVSGCKIIEKYRLIDFELKSYRMFMLDYALVLEGWRRSGAPTVPILPHYQ
jgi:hypothetical protein